MAFFGGAFFGGGFFGAFGQASSTTGGKRRAKRPFIVRLSDTDKSERANTAEFLKEQLRLNHPRAFGDVVVEKTVVKQKKPDFKSQMAERELAAKRAEEALISSNNELAEILVMIAVQLEDE